MKIESFAADLFKKLEIPVAFVDKAGVNAVCNKAAQSVFGIGDEAVSIETLKKITDTDALDSCRQVVAGGMYFDVNVYHLDGGIALVFHNKDDIIRFEERLRNTEEEINILRKENHDYRNQLHMLMGESIQRENGSEVVMKNRKGVPAEAIHEIINYVNKKFIAELLIGKLTRIYDLGIRFNILPDSVCDELAEGIGYDKYITIIGNLIDNAVDELEQSRKIGGIIDFRIVSNRKWTKISVTDNGRGVEDEQEILNKGFSTKSGENRGLGLYVVKEIAEKYNGSVVVESYPGEGFGIDVTIFGIGE